jgi:hypothetical protein
VLERVLTEQLPINERDLRDPQPREILLDYNKHCQLVFGTYIQNHERHDNGMGSRTIGALALRPTGSRRRLARNNWTPLPMPQDVIERVRDMANNMANREQRALAARQRTGPGITFLDRNQRAFADGEAMLIAGVDGDDEQVAGVDNDEDYDYNYEQPGYDMDVNPYNEPGAAEAPKHDASKAPHHHEHNATEAPELDAVKATTMNQALPRHQMTTVLKRRSNSRWKMPRRRSLRPPV